MADASGVESPVTWLVLLNLSRGGAHDFSNSAVFFSEAVCGQLRMMTVIDFWGELDRDVLRCLSETRGGLSHAEIGSRIGISEDAAQSIVTMLAHEGKVRICSVAYGQPSVV
jgi:hypothetical protein